MQKKKINNKFRWTRSLTVTITLMALIAAASFLVTEHITQKEEEHGFEILYQEAEALAKEIETNVQSDCEQLELIASVLARYDDLTFDQLSEFLDNYQTVGMMSSLELLLPNNTVLTAEGEVIDASGILSFEQESALGAHISDREKDLKEENYIVRHYVPVIKNNEIAALLYGVVELDSLPQEALNQYYGGEAAIYIIDGATGDFLVDTWHQEEGGNIWNLGERPMAEGYDHQQLKQGLTEGKSDYVVFVSQSINRYLYFYFQPVKINQWRVALSVPEDVIFAGRNNIRHVLNIFILFESVCFVLYFLWMFHYVWKETNDKQNQLDTINYMYDVENLLFTAHEKEENIMTALGKIAHITHAERLGFWLVEPIKERQAFLWEKKVSEPFLQQWDMAEKLIGYFHQGNSLFYADDKESLQTIFAGKMQIKNMTAIPIKDTDGEICGILSAFNTPDKPENANLLKSVGFSFSMFCHNRRTYNAIKLLGELDALSGLYNRNRYELELIKYEKKEYTSLACIYIDANGLHELNNSQGHEAGDAMLKAIGRIIREKFDPQHAYRIGGDEFVAFILNQDQKTAEQLAKDTVKALDRMGIHVSIGVQWQQEVNSIQDLVRKAEQKMYEAKEAYYHAVSSDRQPRPNRLNLIHASKQTDQE